MTRLLDVLTGLAIATMVAGAIVLAWRMERGPRDGPSGRAYERAARELAQIDPAVVRWRELPERRLALDLRRPLGVALGPDDRIHVVGDRALVVHDAAGRRLLRLATDDEPRCVAVGPRGAIHVGFRRHVEVYSPGGQRLARWPELGSRALLSSIAVGADRVYLADAGARVVHIADRDGRLLRTLGQNRFNVPSPYFEVALRPDGAFDVTNPGVHRIETWRDGRPAGAWGRFGQDLGGFCGCCNPVALARLPGGGYVTAEKGLTRIQWFDAAGSLAGVVAGPDQFPAHELKICTDPARGDCSTGGLDLAADSRGRVLVLDPIAAQLRIFVKKD